MIVPTADEVRRIAEQLAADPGQRHAFLGALLDRSSGSIEDALRVPAPVVPDAPTDVRGYRVRLDLVGAEPPVWRRLELPGDLTLDRVHLVIQAAMGWFDSHLHRFRTGSDHGSPHFITPFDVEEGDDGVLEGDVRLDQVLTGKGDGLWYEYDFGDSWEHVLEVEAVLDEPPAEARCTAGAVAGPPEDCGGIGGYTELAEWVRAGRDPSSVPPPFEDADQALGWLPPDWDPDRFDLAEANLVLTAALAPPVPVAAELAALRETLERRGDLALTLVLAEAATHRTTEVSEADARRILEPYAVLLDVIGDGVRLTGAGYLPPAAVEQLAERTGVTGWWIGKANREDLTWPIALLRDSARALGLVSVRSGRLAPSAIARRSRDQPLALWRHIVSKLPLGRSGFDRDAGWLALAVAGSGAPAEHWEGEIRSLLLGLGWRTEGGPDEDFVDVVSPTLDVLDLLTGKTRRGPVSGMDAAVAATARAAIGPESVPE